MGSWDELCLICGICPAGGPYALLHPSQLHPVSKQIAAEVSAAITDIPDHQLLAIVTDGLSSSFSKHDRRLDYRPVWLPEGLGQRADLSQTDCVAIGYFDEEHGEAPARDDGRVPDGRHVETRVVRNVVGGDFQAVVRDSSGAGGFEEDVRESVCSAVHLYNPNFWVCQKCHSYIHSWIVDDWRTRLLEPANTSAFSDGVFYEIVNSQSQRRTDSKTGTLPGIDYGGIENTLQQWQSFFAPGRRDSKYVIEGIRAGRRDADLIPDIMRDFRCWMFARPDRWPEPDAQSPTFTPFPHNNRGPVSILAKLPDELLHRIAKQLHLEAFLALSSTCRSLRTYLTEPLYLQHVLRESLFRGDHQYILPVTARETIHANRAAERWIAAAGATPVNGVEEPFANPEFPYLRFIATCLTSESMRNRRRIWGVVQQFRTLWLKGPHQRRFYDSNELLESSRRLEQKKLDGNSPL